MVMRNSNKFPLHGFSESMDLVYLAQSKHTQLIVAAQLCCNLQVVLAAAQGKGARDSVSSATDFADSCRFEDIKRVLPHSKHVICLFVGSLLYDYFSTY